MTCLAGECGVGPPADAGADAATDSSPSDTGPMCSTAFPTLCGAECVDTDTDLFHCGACGNACPTPPNAFRNCAGGVCGFTCRPGFGDCDSSRVNGCETNTEGLYPMHCGGCGMTRPEVCDGVDNSCDGRVDEGCPYALDLPASPFHTSALIGAAPPPGTNGNYTGQCGAFQVAVGINGTHTNTIQTLGYRCAGVSMMPSVMAGRAVFTVMTGTAVIGGPPGQGNRLATGAMSFDFVCPPNTVVTRAFGQAMTRIDQIQVECSSLNVTQVGSTWTLEARPAATSPVYGSATSAPFNYACPVSPRMTAGVMPGWNGLHQLSSAASGGIYTINFACLAPILRLR